MRRFPKKGQSTLEYAVIIAVVMAGLLAMQIYLKRGYQNKLRESADEIGAGTYSAGHTTSSFTTTRGSTSTELVTAQGRAQTTYARNIDSRTGNESIEALNQETLFPDSVQPPSQ